jgi:anaphase-promoting complex subunit 1
VLFNPKICALVVSKKRYFYTVVKYIFTSSNFKKFNRNQLKPNTKTQRGLPMPPIVVAEQGPPVSAAREFLSKVTPTPDSSECESPLLRAIKNVLRGTDSDTLNSIRAARFFTGDEAKDYELSWNAQHAVLEYSGVIMKRWCFDHEGESIQSACLGEIEQVVLPNLKSSHSAANYAMFENTSSVNTEPGRSSFGPFHRANIERSRKDESYSEIVPCVFIFLRSIGKMYLMNGIDYTFSLPFIVRKAWPVSPHGVMMQRVLEPSEVVESESNGEEVLPTIFTLTSPFSEAAAVGHTAGILRALPNLPAALKDEEEHSTKPLRSIPPTEMIVWVSHCSVMADAQIVVTVNTKKKLLSIWQYKYIKPKDLAFGSNPGEQSKTSEKAKGKQRQSFSGVGIGSGNRRTSALFDGMLEGRQRHPASPNPRIPDPPILPPEFFDLPDTLPLASLPGMPPSLATTATMASLVSGVTAAKKGKGRRNSLSRSDTMDRMVLGGRTEDSIFFPMDHGRMKAAYWMECLLTHEISENEQVVISKFALSLVHILLQCPPVARYDRQSI